LTDVSRGDRMKVMRLSTDEFIRRFLIHVLPAGFHRIHHAGFLANGIRRDKIAKIRCLIDRAPEPDLMAGEKGRKDRRADGPLNLLVDSTGIKFFGDGAWQARKHGPQGRRQWRQRCIWRWIRRRSTFAPSNSPPAAMATVPYSWTSSAMAFISLIRLASMPPYLARHL